jgi:MoxR-like ATPase
MEETQVTIGETTYSLPHPFFVLATQNPIEHEGTYALPEAELDRFLLKLLVTYPRPEQEIAMLSSVTGKKNATPLPHVLSISLLKSLQTAADAVHVDERLAAYIVSIVGATRPAPVKGGLREKSERTEREGVYRYINFGASPRASIALYRCARIHALFEGHAFVSPDDVKAVALPVLRHRIVLSYEAEADGIDPDAVISRILRLVPVP